MNESGPTSWLSTYLSVLQTQNGLSEHSLKAYRADLHELQTLAQSRPLESLSYHDIRRFSAQLHSRDLNARSIARKLSSWRGFYRWLAQQIELASNPVDGVKAPKKNKPLPKALGVDDVMHLLDSGAHAQSTLQCANRAMFELLYSSGLRVSELASLDMREFHENGYHSQAWLDLNECHVQVVGKGNKQRVVPVGEKALIALQAWLAVRPTLVKTDPYPLFLSERGTRIAVRSIQTRLKTYAQQSGIPAQVHPHVLRHSFASHLLQSSGDLRAVQELLGHASIAATQVYTALDFQHLAKVYDESHPRAKK